MQKPRLTDRTAKAIEFSLSLLRHERSLVCTDKWADNYAAEARDDFDRAIEYLEDLLRWKRQNSRQKARDARNAI